MDAEAIRFSASVGLRFAHRFARACLAPPICPAISYAPIFPFVPAIAGLFAFPFQCSSAMPKRRQKTSIISMGGEQGGCVVSRCSLLCTRTSRNTERLSTMPHPEVTGRTGELKGPLVASPNETMITLNIGRAKLYELI